MMKKNMTFEERALIWGMGFASRTIIEWREFERHFPNASAESRIRSLISRLSGEEYKAAFRTAFGE